MTAPSTAGESSGPPPSTPPSDRVARLTDTLAALRDELEGLRTAARLRSVIEQAKGILMQRHGIGPEDAFEQLRALSQQHNARLVEVAATVVGVAIPSDDLPMEHVAEVVRERMPSSAAASPEWRGLQAQPDVQAGVVGALLDVVAAGTARGREAAELLAELLAPFDVEAVTLYRRLPDESLQLCGQFGVPGDLISSWSHIPPTPDIPYVASVVSGRSLFWGQQAPGAQQHPATAEVASQFEAAAAVPIVAADSVVGVAGLMWCQARPLDDDEKAALGALVQRIGPVLLRDVTATDPEVEWLGAVLSLQLDPWIMLEVVATADEAGDFLLVDLAHDVAPGADTLGRRLREVWPTLAADGTFEALVRLASSGGGWTITITEESEPPWGVPGTRVRAVRLGGRVIVVWRSPHELDAADSSEGVSATSDSAC